MANLRKFIVYSACSFFMLAMITGCQDMKKRDVGTLVGAGAGAYVGHQLSGGSAVGAVGGAVAGGVIGHEIGKSTE